MGPSIRLAVVLVGVVATTGAVISTRSGDGQSGPRRSGSAPLHTKSSGVAAQARVDAFALVAKRIYAHEHAAVVGRSVVKHLSQNAALLRALRSGDLPKIRSEARQAVIPHEVRVR